MTDISSNAKLLCKPQLQHGWWIIALLLVCLGWLVSCGEETGTPNDTLDISPQTDTYEPTTPAETPIITTSLLNCPPGAPSSRCTSDSLTPENLFSSSATPAVYYFSTENEETTITALTSEIPAASQVSTLEGGQLEDTFWAKDRQASAPVSLESFYQTLANKVAVSEHFVLYVEKDQSEQMEPVNAANLLLELESAYDRLLQIYGVGIVPDVQQTGRIVVLALDILDDYNALTNPEYVSGFFAPRDLFGDDLTSQLYDTPEALQHSDFPDLISLESAANLRGRSNENQVLYLDIDPFYNGTAYAGETGAQSKVRQLALETLLHEASHLFSYYARVLAYRLPRQSDWIAEGLAEQAPQLLASLTTSQSERLAQWSLFSSQVVLSSNQPSLLRLDDADALVGTVQVNLFFNYLRHRTTATDETTSVFNQTITARDSTTSGLDETIQQNLEGESFSSMYGDWVLTNWIYASGRNIQQIYATDGTVVSLGGGTVGTRRYELSYDGVGIGKSGQNGLAFQEDSLPLSYDTSYCLEPASHLYFDYYTSGSDDTFVPANNGMDEGIQVILAELVGETDAVLRFYEANSSIPLDRYKEGEHINIILYNPNYTGDCLSSGMLPSDLKNPASWIGGGKSGWQSGHGAEWQNLPGYFFRTTGLAAHLASVQGGEQNYLYVADAIQHGISRWDLNAGTFQGRIGSPETDCANDNLGDDGWTDTEEKFVNNHCRRSFNTPQGLAVDSAGNLYVADQNNFRIVKRDSDGDFSAWLGHPTDEAWQTLSGAEPLERSEMLDYQTNTSMFNSPWGLAIDESKDTPWLYVSNFGAGRITRRNLSTGEFAGFIGNGVEGWETSIADQQGLRNNTPNYFRYPKGIAVDSAFIYVADEANHRISRWTLDGLQGSAESLSEGYWIGGGLSGWHSGETDAGSGNLYFDHPADVHVDDTYLYVADRKNQRVSRWNKQSGEFAGWLGHGANLWTTDEDGPEAVDLGNAVQYPPDSMLEPNFLLNVPANLAGSNQFLYTTTIYNGRLSRWNLSCIQDNVSKLCNALE